MTTLEVLWILSFAVAVLLALVLVGSVGAGRGLTGAALAVAAYGLAGDALMAWRQADVAGWVETPARVVVSERGRSANAWSFAYEYQVGGETYRDSRVTFRPHLRGRDDTDRMASTWPAGTSLTVYRDPENPSRAVVEKAPSYGLPATGLALHGGLLAALAYARRRAGRASLPS